MQLHQEPTPESSSTPTQTTTSMLTTTAAAAAPGTMLAASAIESTATRSSNASQEPGQEEQAAQSNEIQLTDEQILTQMQAIKDEEANAHPLVDNAVDLTELEQEYENGSQAFKNKIKVLERIKRTSGNLNITNHSTRLMCLTDR